MVVSDIPHLRAFWPIVETSQSAISFLVSRRVFALPRICASCGGFNSLSGATIRCTRDGCRKRTSLLAHSFFAGSRIPVHDVLLLGYIWLTGGSYSQALALTTHSSATLVAYYSYFRQVVISSLDDVDTCIGGPDIVVEVDESKFGKRKHNRGKHIEGAWVIGGIERTSAGKFFVEVVEKRDSETIFTVLSKHILPGTILHTDCWRAYTGIGEVLDVTHKSVNHSLGFKDAATGVHTNSIVGKWTALKRKITLRGRVVERLDGYLLEQVWRNMHKEDLWSAFLGALAEIHYD